MDLAAVHLHLGLVSLNLLLQQLLLVGRVRTSGVRFARKQRPEIGTLVEAALRVRQRFGVGVERRESVLVLVE